MELPVSLTSVTLMLSLAGVYAVTAFAVARRTREIGVRVALGVANNDLSDVHLDDFRNTAVFVLSTILCCVLACIVPTRRALRIQPTEALKDEA